MYAGVPTAEPAIVSLLPECDAGRSVSSAHRLGRRVVAADDLGQSPVDHQGLAVGAQHDIGRLQVAMDHAPAVGVGDRVADVDEPAQELAEGQGALGRIAAECASARWNRSMASLRLSPADEPHGVERPALVVRAQAVDRHDAGMLQPAGDLGLEQEAGAAGRVVGVLGLDLLERDLAVQLRIHRDEYHADPAPGVVPQETEPASFRRRLAQAEAGVAGFLGIERGPGADRLRAEVRRIEATELPEPGAVT